MTEVSIKNFQSIKSIDFEIDGFTVIIGKNNIGKSAVIRAIDSALTNQVGSEFIRMGEKKTTVQLKHGDLAIKWEKGTSATYEIKKGDGEKQDFSKLSGAVPKPILEAGFDGMEIEGKKAYPLIAHQFEPLFLLNRRGSVVTEVLANLYDLDTLSVADDLCQKELKSNKSQLKVREGDLKNLQESLAKYADFEEIKKEVTALTAKEDEYKLLQADVFQLIDFEEQLQSLQAGVNALQSIQDVTVPDLKKCAETMTLVYWLAVQEEEYLKLDRSVKILAGLETIDIPDTRVCADVIQEIGWLQTQENELEDIKRRIFRMDTHLPQMSHDLSVMGELCNLAVKFQGELDEIQKWESEYDSLSKVTQRTEKILAKMDTENLSKQLVSIETGIKELAELGIMEKDFMTAAKAAKTTRTELSTAEKEYNTAGAELAEIKICPLCEKPR
jgi:DNA repair ATPase RecN